MTDTPESRVREALAAMTKAPWGVERCEATPCFHIDAGAYPHGTSICEMKEQPSAKADAGGIVTLRNDVPALLDLIDSLCAELRARGGG